MTSLFKIIAGAWASISLFFGAHQVAPQPTPNPIAGAFNTPTNNSSAGTVTSITASAPLTGGTITGSGSIGLGTVGIANGGTSTTTQVTNGVNYYDGTKITSGTALTYDGTKLTVSNASTTQQTSHSIYADGTDGLIIANSQGTTVATLGVTNTQNTAMLGGLTIATTLGVTGASTLATTTVQKNLSVTGGASTGTTVATDASTITVNWQNGNTQEVVLGATGRTLAFTNVTAGTALKLWVWQDAAGSRTITTYPTGTHWAGGTAPTLTTTAGKFDILVFTTATSTTQFSAGASLNY